MAAKPTGAVAPIHASRPGPAFLYAHPSTGPGIVLRRIGAEDEGRAE